MSNYLGHPHTRTVPDPNDRTVNDPAILIEARHIRAFVQHTASSSAKAGELLVPELAGLSSAQLDFPTPALREKIVDWYIVYATAVMGWPQAVQLGQSVLLSTVPVVLVPQMARRLEWRSAPDGQH